MYFVICWYLKQSKFVILYIFRTFKISCSLFLLALSVVISRRFHFTGFKLFFCMKRAIEIEIKKKIRKHYHSNSRIFMPKAREIYFFISYCPLILSFLCLFLLFLNNIFDYLILTFILEYNIIISLFLFKYTKFNMPIMLSREINILEINILLYIIIIL